MNGKIFQFEDYLLDVSEQRLQKNGADISLPPKVFEVLTVLVKRPQQLVTYQELMEEVWQDTFVEETNLRYSVHALRKILSEDFIETVPKRGYRFNAKVASFTKEEFIKLHTGSFKKDELMELVEETPPKPQSAFRNYAAFAVIALLMTGVGVLGYYFWQNGKKGQTDKSIKTIVVLPFKIIGEESVQNRNFQKALFDSIVFDLGKIRGIKTTEQEGNADIILEGGYRYENEQSVQVDLKLTRISDGKDLLNESFSVKADTKFKTEKTVSLQIARRTNNLIGELVDEELLKNQNINEEVRKNYLVGQKLLRNYELNRQQEGLEAFEKIIKAEPNWAKGYAKYAEASVLLHGGMPDWEKVKQFAEKSLAMDEKMPEAHLAMGWYYQANFDWENAEKSFAKAIELNPEYSEAYNEYGLLLNIRRKFTEAEKMFLKAIELKPFDPFYFASICQHYYYTQKSHVAKRSCQEALNIDPDFNLANKQMFWIYVDLTEWGEVFKHEFGDLTEEEVERNPIGKPLKDGNIKLYWQRRIENRLANPKRRYSPLTISVFYAQILDKENTLKYLEELDEISPIEVPSLNPDPSFDFVRRETRFINVMKRRNLQP